MHIDFLAFNLLFAYPGSGWFGVLDLKRYGWGAGERDKDGVTPSAVWIGIWRIG